ncbi:MAG TPA: hypothetical protein VF014_05730, partial [Casimicrobiaceae bacterium]|nr:hypothetical protein [Casimicrobiaceae bacterium]
NGLNLLSFMQRSVRNEAALQQNGIGIIMHLPPVDARALAHGAIEALRKAFLRVRLGRDFDERASRKRFRHSLDICGENSFIFSNSRTFAFWELCPDQALRPQRLAIARQSRGRHSADPDRADRGDERSVRVQALCLGNPRRLQTERRGMLNNNLHCSAFCVWKDGEIVPESAARCPRTLNALGRGFYFASEEPHAIDAVLAAAAGRSHLTRRSSTPA